MKKVLMVMGFALCASVAFAQTARIDKNDVRKAEKAPVNATKAPVDYKASVFAKAGGHDTIEVFKIDVASDYTIGVVTASDRINDTLVGSANAHNVSGDANKWMRFSSIADFNSRAATAISGLYNWLLWDSDGDNVPDEHLYYITEDIDPALSPREPNDDGFMFLSYMESGLASGRFNTYFTLPQLTRPDDAVMIEVSLTQCYRKYYDQCFIDYKVNNLWYAREINITGIDAAVNSWSPNKVRYVMPYGLNNTNNIELRIRAYSWHRGSAFGYFWAVDNVAVMKLTQSQFWSLNSPTNIDGFYGMIPEGMTIPLTWGVNAQNLSIDPINNAKASVYAGSSRNSLTQVLQGPSVNVAAGNFDIMYPLLINERGFYVEDQNLTSGYQSWPNEGTHTNYGNPGLPNGFLGRSLPTTTSGKNFYNITVTGGNLSRTYDTVLYYVSPIQSYNYEQTGRETGYRWSHDNGIITSDASFQVAFTDDHYVTNSGSSLENGGHVNMAGYAVHARFITGNDIPQGWVFRGLELITATDRDASDMEGASIIPVAYKDAYSDDGVSFESLPCGIDGMAYEVEENAHINSNLIQNGGYILPEAGYKAINIQFVEQPVLEPNTSYRFGYRLNDDAMFALAGTRSNFLYTDTAGTVRIGFGYGVGANDTIARYAQAAQGANDYRYVPTPATYLEVMAYDPIEGDYVTAWNIDNYPMIRPIVGPARAVEYCTLIGDCTNNTVESGVRITRQNDELCNTTLSVTAGSQQRIDFDPIGDHSVIDSVIYDNGTVSRALVPVDEETGEGDYLVGDASIVDSNFVLLDREFWVLYMTPQMLTPNSEHTFTVYSHYEEFNQRPHEGIDPVAPEVNMRLAPNPATSSVKLNLKGVTGMVNCSILDMSGRVVYNANINAESEHIINVSNIPAGAYFVRVTNDTFSKIEKLIIK